MQELEMKAELATLERKHQIAIQAMRSKTSDEKVAEKSEIIRSFVNKSGQKEVLFRHPLLHRGRGWSRRRL